MKRYPILLSLLTLLFLCFTSDVPDEIILNKRLLNYLEENPSTNLFLHIDKSIYAPEESIWFKAYTLSGKVIDSKVLYVRLADAHKNIVVSEQFPVYDIRSHGNIFIPDTLQEGDYYLYAFTDRMINFSERDVFLQKIRVQREVAKRFEAKAIVTDTTKIKRGQKINILVTVKEGIDLIKNLRGEYELSDGSKTIKAARITTNLFGEAHISFVYPNLPDDKNLQVKATFNRKGERAELILNLRHEGNKIKLSAFPEGGNLVQGITTKVMLQADDLKDIPVKDAFRLMGNGKEMLRFSTNEYGLGSFSLTPQADVQYEIETINQANSTHLPLAVKADGIALKTSNSGKTFIALHNQSMESLFYMVCRNQEEVLAVKELSVRKGDSVTIPVVFKDIPKSVVSISILDGNGKVRAERLLLNKSREDYKVNIKTEKASYNSKSKINAQVNVANDNGDPVMANISVAVVEKSRIDPLSYKNILNYYYYRFLDGSNCNNFIGESIEKDLDELLITKTWYNNETERVLTYAGSGSPGLISNAGGLTGRIISKTRKNPTIKNIVLSSKEGMVVADLDPAFSFSVLPKLLEARKGNLWQILNLDQIYDGGKHEIIINRYEHTFDTCFVKSSFFQVPQVFNTIQTNKPVQVTKTGNNKVIKEVSIKARYTDIKKDIERERQRLESAQMDRYCRNGIRNCKNHPEDNYPPPDHIAEKLAILNAMTEVRKIPIKNISLPENFPLVDFENGQNAAFTTETTLYWNPNFGTAQNGQNSFSFFSNDIKGDFMIIVQGIDVSNLKPLYGTCTFNVK